MIAHAKVHAAYTGIGLSYKEMGMLENSDGMGIVRVGSIQAVLDAMVQADPSLAALLENSNHPYSCTCDGCLDWWISMGPEDVDADGTLHFGPFSQDRIAERLGADAEQKFKAWREMDAEPVDDIDF